MEQNIVFVDDLGRERELRNVSRFGHYLVGEIFGELNVAIDLGTPHVMNITRGMKDAEGMLLEALRRLQEHSAQLENAGE